MPRIYYNINIIHTYFYAEPGHRPEWSIPENCQMSTKRVFRFNQDQRTLHIFAGLVLFLLRNENYRRVQTEFNKPHPLAVIVNKVSYHYTDHFSRLRQRRIIITIITAIIDCSDVLTWTRQRFVDNKWTLQEGNETLKFIWNTFCTLRWFTCKL